MNLIKHLQALPPEERRRRVVSLSDEELAPLKYIWELWARPEQILPPGNWRTWLQLGGRGSGKTRSAAEAVRIWARTHKLVNIVGATSDDVRDIMVEGPSGILSVCPDDERPLYVPSKRRLEWPNGGISLLFTADEPERLRGKQHEKVWADELASWRFAQNAFDQAMLGLRLGTCPQCIITTTPKPIPLLKQLLSFSSTVTTRTTTFDNRENLAEEFISQIVSRYQGTRLGRQELNAELLSDNPGALWKHDMLDMLRVQAAPHLTRVVVGVDPAVTNTEVSDLTGIVVVGVAPGGHFYVLDDCSLRGSPDTWASSVVAAYRKHRCDRVVAEVNNGGDLVQSILRSKCGSLSYKKVHASRGKLVRAEPVAALYEQGRVHHVGSLSDLEDEMCDYSPQSGGKSPDRMDALVWAVTELTERMGMGGGMYDLECLLHGVRREISPLPWYENLEEALRESEAERARQADAPSRDEIGQR